MIILCCRQCLFPSSVKKIHKGLCRIYDIFTLTTLGCLVDKIVYSIWISALHNFK